MLKKWSRLEVRDLILFLWTNNVSTSEIHSQIVEVYGEEAISRHVAKFCHSFQSGREDVGNRNREASGRPNPDLAPSDYFRFGKFKENLSGTRFSSNSDVKTAAVSWLNGRGRDPYQAGLNKLDLHLDKCLNRFDDYVEK
ncbi:hypothetical protein AVEN_54078-1 [Araneus ventricosus]|uniref:Mos1 transposase HTH domain-containing protein n=1 Tax=Araneus ventricosus TaxID=182803 RepID=A0A4Y2ICT2_ARAVE|nr:hypothetical protein AVEN_54078-1 [Araneus ventricosus]